MSYTLASIHSALTDAAFSPEVHSFPGDIVSGGSLLYVGSCDEWQQQT